jgi:hypothetical protein
MVYFVNLTNPEDIQDAGPSSFGTGKYGFRVTSDRMNTAIDAILYRAKKEGFLEKGGLLTLC